MTGPVEGDTRTDAVTDGGALPSAPAIPGLAVLTVAYRSGACLPVLAADLARQRRPPEHWIVVDNSPDSAPVELPALEGLRSRRVQGMEGAGFGDGCNRGFEALRGLGWGGWVWLLNPDIRLASGDELLDLLQALATLPANAVVGTVVCDGEGGVEPSGGWLSDGLRFRGVTLQAQHQQALAPVAVDWLSGCSLALQPEAHRPPARFDPAFPLYYEDMDLCRRLAGQGAPLLWLPGIRVGHRRGSGSSTPEPRRLRLSTLGYLRYLRRHTPGWVMALRSARLLLLSLLRLPWRPRRSLAVLAAMLEVLQDPEGCRG